MAFPIELLAGVAQAIPDITAQFNKGYQQNQLSIAEANARAAEAAAVSDKAEPKSQVQIVLIVVAAIALLAFLVFILKK